MTSGFWKFHNATCCFFENSKLRRADVRKRFVHKSKTNIGTKNGKFNFFQTNMASRRHYTSANCLVITSLPFIVDFRPNNRPAASASISTVSPLA